MLNPSEITFVAFSSSARRHLICVGASLPVEEREGAILGVFPDACDFRLIEGEEDEEEGCPLLLSWNHRNGQALFPQGQALRLAS